MSITSSSFTRYYGLPNGAAQAYYICRNFLDKKHPVLFVSAQDLDDFDHAAQSFSPVGTQLLSFPSTDTAQMRFLHQLLSHKNGPVLISAPYEALATPLPRLEDFRARTHMCAPLSSRLSQEHLVEREGEIKTNPKPLKRSLRGYVVLTADLNKAVVRLHDLTKRRLVISADLAVESIKGALFLPRQIRIAAAYVEYEPLPFLGYAVDLENMEPPALLHIAPPSDSRYESMVFCAASWPTQSTAK